MDKKETIGIAEISPERDKAIRLFTYLKELCALRTTHVRNVASYDQVFWINDIPHHKLCRCSIWHLIDVASPQSEQHLDTWIEVRKPVLKSPPELPDDLEPWIKDEELADSSLSEPGIYEQIPLSAIQEDSANTDPTAFVSINEYPNVFDKWINYLEEKWKPWAIEDRELQKVQKVYNQLFNIYQRQEKLGEQYEVIIGAGLLLWKSPKSGEIKRHILTFQTRIDFDRHRGVLIVGSPLPPDGQKPTLEYAMLEINDWPNATELNEIEEKDLPMLADNPWDVDKLNRVLCGFSNALPIPGDYYPSFERSDGTIEKPVVRFAPALILRKRTRRTFEDFYSQIVGQIKEGVKIPENIRWIIDIVEDYVDEEKEMGGIKMGVPASTPSDNELYFPLPANDEQKIIAQKAEHRRGVLVQGPPGTGKSHTIANLVSHFLAKGKRVLVTSETPRALDVLRKKLPAEIKELCVVWLGSDRESKEALRKSVDGITSHKANWNAQKERNLVEQHARRLDEERKEQARLNHDLRACRELDVYLHSNISGRYSGTFQQIAVQINQERDRFRWFADRPGDVEYPHVTADELLKMLGIHRNLSADIVEQLEKYRLPLEQLPQPNQFCRLVDAERKSNLMLKETQDKPWADRASKEILGGQDRVWQHILTTTVDHIDRIEHLIKEYGNLDVMGLVAKNLRLVGDHALALKKHIEMGRGLGFWFFRSRVVKDGLYLIKTVAINGKPCDNVQVLNQLIAWIEISIRLNDIADLWNSVTTLPAGNAVMQCHAYRDLCKPIECAFAVKKDIAMAQGVLLPLAASLANFIGSGNNHASVEQLRQAVSSRDSKLYREAYESLSSLHSWADDYNFACAVHKHFYDCAPQTCKNYDESYNDPVWDKRFAEFEAAWCWAKTDRWLDEAGDRERPKQIQQALENSILRERDTLKKLAAAKAWQHCIQNLGTKEEQALKAWKLAVGKIREYGKDAEYWREFARQKLEECRNAIPAWVMPLYQVVQTTKPGRAAYDIAIIDEASQSGPEALFLHYIADKLIIVGDDKQITPMYIGIELENAHSLRKKYLEGIPNAALLMPGRDTSLFAQAFLKFRDHIQLREHFRCMPEIIQFSNNLSYPNEPLIPLRQYGADRLKPVRTVFVKEGYRKGASEDIENSPEAEAIVAQIAECCEDPAYMGKTFGVISLMGSRQAGSRQTELINRLLLGKDGIGAQEIEKRRLVCGRPYDFQGDERDVIFLSMVDAPQDGQQCRKICDVDTQRRFNVAASRARDQLWLFHSMTLNDLKPECLRYRLLAYCLNPAVMQPEPIGETTLAELRRMARDPSIRQAKKRGEKVPGTQFDSWFEVDVFFKIVDRGYRVLPQFHVNTRYIDLVVEGLRGRLAVECDGDEAHMDRWEEDQIRQRELERCGWIFWRVRGHDFYRDQEASLVGLWETLERLKITPRHSWESERKQSEIEVIETGCIRTENMAKAQPEKDKIETVEESDQEELSEEAISSKDTEGRLDRALEYAKLLRPRPEEQPPAVLQNAIIQVLKKCPNNSCTIKSLPARVLRELGLRTRGNPRLEFEKRIMRNLGVLKRKGLVEEYKAKNKRIRLLRFQETLW